MRRTVLLSMTAAALALGVWVACQRQMAQLGASVLPAAEAAAKPVSAVFIVRHAEKDGECLSPEGKERARRLAEVFKYAKVHHLVASKLCRTRETLEPLAALQKIEAKQIAEVGDLDVASAAEVAKLVRSYKPGDVSVVAHHSTTVQEIAEELGVPKGEARSIDTVGNDTIALVLLPAEGGAQLVQLAYR